MPPEHVPICVHVFVWLPDCGQSVGDRLNVQLLSSQGTLLTEAVQMSEFSPLCKPAHVHVTELPGAGKVGLVGSAVPALHKSPVKSFAV